MVKQSQQAANHFCLVLYPFLSDAVRINDSCPIDALAQSKRPT